MNSKNTVKLDSELHGTFVADSWTAASIHGAIILEVDPRPGQVAAFVSEVVGGNDYTDLGDFELSIVLASLDHTAVGVRDALNQS